MLRRDPWLTPCLAGAAPAYADSRVPEHPKYCRTFRFTCATSLSFSRGNPAGIIRIGLDKTSVHGKVIPAAITKKPRLGLPVVRGAGYYPEPHVVESRAKFNPASPHCFDHAELRCDRNRLESRAPASGCSLPGTASQLGVGEQEQHPCWRIRRRPGPDLLAIGYRHSEG
jgi:hypothetical protein